MMGDIFWKIASSALALEFDGAVLVIALAVGFFPLARFFPAFAPYVEAARLGALLIALLIAMLLGFRISNDRADAKNLRALIAAQQADLKNAREAAEDQARRASEIEGTANEQRKKDDAYISSLENRPACDLPSVVQPSQPGPAKKPAARARRSNATCSRAGAGTDARCAWRLNTSALMEANKRLSESAAWYEAVRKSYGAP